MRAPLSWLQEFTDCRLPVEELAERLTMSGLEVEAIDRIGAFSNQALVARIVRAVEIPEADHLRRVELDLGDDKTATAVTGAPNIPAGTEGLKVAAALPGAVLIRPDAPLFETVKVEEKILRGVTSNAVLCSEKELGLGGDHGGVLILDPDAPLGRPFREYRTPPADAEADIVLDVAILPNYGRCLSIIGMAREIAALTRCSFRTELTATYVPLDPKAFPIEIQAPDLCPRYSGFVLNDVTVKPSPAWLARRLVLAGLKPINNLVDVTNYVMLELGQPMHAFDLERLPARSIEVRRARPGEELYTLDQNVESETKPPPRRLEESTLLITSGDKPVAVAGVIGGLESEISPQTKDVLLESANFNAASIRKAMTTLKVNTDAAVRFSRQVDRALTVLAIQRATHLMVETAGARPSAAIADCYAEEATPTAIEVTPAEICRILGMDIGGDEIQKSLERLGFTVEKESGAEERLLVHVPGFRSDVTMAADLAEEVIRVVGFDRLPAKEIAESLPQAARNAPWEIKQRLRDVLVACNLQDVINYSLTTAEVEERVRLDEDAGSDGEGLSYLSIVNPSSQERSALRRTLMSGLVETVARNQHHRQRIALFEIGPVFHPEKGDGTLPLEETHLSIALSGPIEEPSWRESQPREYSFFDLKGMVTGMLDRLHIEDHAFERHASMPYHPGIAARLLIAGEAVGTLGQLHPDVVEAYGLGSRAVIAAEFDLTRWIEAARGHYPYRPFSRHPSLRQDLNLVVDEEVEAARVTAAIREAAGPLLVDIRLFDIYRGNQLDEGKKSLVFQLTFCSEERSLQEEEVNAIRDSILEPLKERIGAQIRT